MTKFNLIFKEDYFNKGDLLESNYIKLKVLSKPKRKWYHIFLKKLTFRLYKANYFYEVEPMIETKKCISCKKLVSKELTTCFCGSEYFVPSDIKAEKEKTKVKFLFRPLSLWIGIHYSTFNNRTYINLIPCFTIRIDWKKY